MTSGLASPAAARPNHASHMSGSYSVARLKASAAYADITLGLQPVDRNAERKHARIEHPLGVTGAIHRR